MRRRDNKQQQTTNNKQQHKNKYQHVPFWMFKFEGFLVVEKGHLSFDRGKDRQIDFDGKAFR
jgi:hypothetical protein